MYTNGEKTECYCTSMSSGTILGEEIVRHFKLFFIFDKFLQLLIFSENVSHVNMQRYNLGAREALVHQLKPIQHRGLKKNGFADEMGKSSKTSWTATKLCRQNTFHI